ncbi:MAG: hypothetical protein AMXMBFR33_37510 [Candidatus Xenobia bacterium]|jgi:phosphonate transport system substrate-binding protein
MLKAVSMLSENHAPAYREVTRRLADRLGMPVQLEEQVPWRQRQRRLLAGEAHLGFLCGLPYVEKADRLELLAAPVMKGARYRDRPVYFSDVVVRSNSPFQTLADLRGARWAYNESESHSGYNVVRAHLARRGWQDRFFGSSQESGAHLTSLDWILTGRVDASALDSTVLDTELEARPELLSQIRVLERLGPSPIQPAVASLALQPDLRALLRDTLLELKLENLPMVRFAAVTDADYDPIRAMLREARPVQLA